MGQQVDRNEQERAGDLALRVACGLQQGGRGQRGILAHSLLLTAGAGVHNRGDRQVWLKGKQDLGQACVL